MRFASWGGTLREGVCKLFLGLARGRVDGGKKRGELAGSHARLYEKLYRVAEGISREA